MAAPTRDEILKDTGFKRWWKAQNLGLHWETQIKRGKRDWLADYEEYLVSQGIYPPWKVVGPPSPEPSPAPTDYTPEQIAEYEAYLEYIKNNPDLGLPTPSDIADYFENRDKWLEEYIPPEEEEEAPPEEEEKPPEEEEPEYSDEDYREYNTYRSYASAYGDPSDWYALNIGDYFANWDVAQEQLREWQTEETERQTEQEEYERGRAEAERWALSPEEQARRREESYTYGQKARERSEYAAREAYRETPEYSKGLQGWLGTQEAESQPLQQWMRAMFPTFQREYEAELPRLTGYPTREAARKEAERREKGLEQWLRVKEPEIEERFWLQRPYERGERPSLYAPRLRGVSY